MYIVLHWNLDIRPKAFERNMMVGRYEAHGTMATGQAAAEADCGMHWSGLGQRPLMLPVLTVLFGINILLS